MVNPTKELRVGLDELGVEHFDHENGEPLRDLSEAGADPATSWRMGDASVCAVPNKHGTFDLWIDNCTPEQAIAATVSTGTLTAEQVRECTKEVYFEGYSDGATHRVNGIKETDWQAIADRLNAMLGAATCIYVPDETGFTWWDENDAEHYEEHSASDECCSASCDKCGNQMMVGDDGWFNGWDEITDWWEEDGSYHKGYVLEPRFKYCPNCGARLVGA